MNGTTACKWDTVIPLDKHILFKVNGKNKSLNEEQFIYHRMSKGITFKQAKKEFDENHKEGMWDKLNKLIKPNGAIVLFGSEPFSSALRMSNIKNYKYDWIWEKQKASNFM